MASATYALFRQAIVTGHQVACLYQGHPRELCPHIIGHNIAGDEVVLAWQFAGSSSRGLAPHGDWRCLHLADVRLARLREGPWHTGAGHKTAQSCVTKIDVDVNVHVGRLR